MRRIVMLVATLVVAAPAYSGSFYISTFQKSTTSAVGGVSVYADVREYDAQTGQFTQRVIGPIASTSITGMTFGPDRKLYLSVVDYYAGTNGRVLVYTTIGTGQRTVIRPGVGGLESPAALRFGPDGNLYVASNSPVTDRVLKFTRTGAFRATVGLNLETPREIAFAPDGALLVSNGGAPSSSIYRFDTVTSAFLGALVATHAGGLRNPTGFAYGRDRNLYVAGFSEVARNYAVLRFNGQTGAFIDVFASLGPLGLLAPFDLVFGPDGNLFVRASNGDGRGAVVRFNGKTGEFLDYFLRPTVSSGLSIGISGMFFVDPGCARYGDYGFANRCFVGEPET